MNAVAFKPAIEPVKPSGPFDKSSGSTSSTSASSTGPRRERISAVVRSLPPSGIRRFFDLVAEMKGVVSLGVGEPDFVTPQHVRDMAMYSLEQGYTSYTSNFGLLELREAISDYLRHFIGNVYDPRKEILVTVGVSEAVDLALRAILEPGDEVIIPEPCYVSYKPCTVLAGGVPVVVSTTVQNGFQLTARDLESHITGRTKAILLCYPNNPTGATLSYENMEGIASIAVKHDLLVISDEIYGELTYSGTHVSIASFPDMQERTIVLNGFSKAHAMTGWRIGYAAGPSDIIAAMVKIHQYVALCAPITAQKAAYEALLHGDHEKERMKNRYDERRRLIVRGLNDIGLACFEPKGAFYAFPSIAITGMSSEEFAERLLQEEKVAVVPGNAFGQSGEGYVRCSYAASVDNILIALERMARFVERHRSS